MLRVMIVDDEPIIRYGIKASIDWDREGFTVVGDFANGAEALNRMETEHVDILITDIKMPVMDGLSLIRKAIKVNPRLKSVLVSSYNDFEYVREGMKLGVVDYILKHTLEPEELLSIVKRCAEMIDKEEQLRSRLSGMNETELARNRKRFEQGLKRYLVHNKDRNLEDQYPNWIEEQYVAAYAKLNRVRTMEEELGFLYASVVVEQLIDCFYRRVPLGIALPTAENELFFLVPWEANSEHLLKGLRKELERETGASLSFGYEKGEGKESIYVCFQHSREACERSFFEGEGGYAYQGEPPVKREGDDLPSLLQSIPISSDERIREAVLRWKDIWVKGGTHPARLKEEAGRVLSNMYKESADTFALVESFDRLFKAESLDELCDFLLEQISELRRLAADKVNDGASENPVDQAIGYMHSNYLDPISLQQVADSVHVSKNYFSILFKKHTGRNFIDYLIDLRLQRAKELLSGSDAKIYEVAEQSGFNDVKYFSKLFKKITGFSPVDYREYHKSIKKE